MMFRYGARNVPYATVTVLKMLTSAPGPMKFQMMLFGWTPPASTICDELKLKPPVTLMTKTELGVPEIVSVPLTRLTPPRLITLTPGPPLIVVVLVIVPIAG